MNYDVFNGDADGIISLVQLRRAQPLMAELVTGRKRDIKLLGRVNAKQGDNVTVLDVSMRTNGDDLRRILKAGADVFYADHHNAGDIPKHPNLKAMIDTSPEMCTAMLIDKYLNGAYRAWAVTASFGDNFRQLAIREAKGLDLPLEKLERLGMLVNYNGYGAGVEDLHFHPADLYRHLADFDTPMEFLSNKADIFEALDKGYEDDLAKVQNLNPMHKWKHAMVIALPGTAASRRISGVYGNMLAQKNPDCAHAILTVQAGGFLVSIRAPLSKRTGADELALQFDTGGGRAAAAGINHLPMGDLDRFNEAFRTGFL